MPAKYKLTYFSTRGMGEPIRFLLAYGSIQYEDVRVKLADWPDKKSTTPFGKLPILEVDGKVIHQSLVICRYLAKKLNLNGESDWDAVEADAIVCTIGDITPRFQALVLEQDEKAKAEIAENLKKEVMPFYLSRFDDVIKRNGGHFVKGKLTWADLYFSAMIEQMVPLLGSDGLSKYPNVKALMDTVFKIPQIKTWMTQRPADVR